MLPAKSLAFACLWMCGSLLACGGDVLAGAAAADAATERNDPRPGDVGSDFADGALEGGSGGESDTPPTAECTALANIAFGEVVWGDPAILPGSIESLGVTIVNASTLDDDFGAGVAVTADDGRVLVNPAESFVNPLLASESTVIPSQVTFAPTLARGMSVDFDVSIVPIPNPLIAPVACSGLATTKIHVVLQ